MVQEGKKEGQEGGRKGRKYISVSWFVLWEFYHLFSLTFQNWVIEERWFISRWLRSFICRRKGWNSLSPLSLTVSKVQIHSQEASASLRFVFRPVLKTHLLPEYCLELKSRHSFRKGTPNQVAFRWVLHMGLIITLIAAKVCRGQWYTLHPYPEVCFLVIKQISHFLHGSWTFHSYANVWAIALSQKILFHPR